MPKIQITGDFVTVARYAAGGSSAINDDFTCMDNPVIAFLTAISMHVSDLTQSERMSIAQLAVVAPKTTLTVSGCMEAVRYAASHVCGMHFESAEQAAGHIIRNKASGGNVALQSNRLMSGRLKGPAQSLALNDLGLSLGIWLHKMGAMSIAPMVLAKMLGGIELPKEACVTT
jgi:hypothetical protein